MYSFVLLYLFFKYLQYKECVQYLTLHEQFQHCVTLKKVIVTKSVQIMLMPVKVLILIIVKSVMK